MKSVGLAIRVCSRDGDNLSTFQAAHLASSQSPMNDGLVIAVTLADGQSCRSEFEATSFGPTGLGWIGGNFAASELGTVDVFGFEPAEPLKSAEDCGVWATPKE
jgi:hypothetical protein